MSITFIVGTQFGPYQQGSKLIVGIPFARDLVQQYGNYVNIRSSFPGTYWFQPGNTLYVDKKGFIPPPPPYGGSINVVFRLNLGNYRAGRSYPMTVQALSNLVYQYGLTAFDADGSVVSPNDYRDYIGDTLYVDRSIYALKQNQQPSVYANPGFGLFSSYNAQ